MKKRSITNITSSAAVLRARTRGIFLVIVLTALGTSRPAQAAQESPQSFTFQGQLLNQAGTAPLTDTVSFTLDIYDPTGVCLLYEEKQSGIDLAQTNGLFSIAVGSATGNSKRTTNDPTLTMAQVFANTGALTRNVGAANCTAGYTADPGDVRTLRVTVTPLGGAAVTLAPDQIIDSAPQAMVAETLQGIGPTGFVQVTGNTTAYTAQKAALDAVLGTAGVVDASAYHNHDGRYVQIGTTPQNVGSGGWYTSGVAGAGVAAAPTGTQFEVLSTGNATVGETIKAASGQSADLLDIENNSGSVLAGFNSGGYLTLPGAPTSANQAATKGYVDGQTYLTQTGITTGLGYTPVNKSGDTGIGALALAPSTFLTLGVYGSPPSCTAAGQIWYAGGSIQYCNNSNTVETLGTSGAGLQSLNGQTGNTQTFGTPGTTGTAPNWVSATNTHTLNIPLASSASVTAGLIANSDYTSFSGKVGGGSNLSHAGTLTEVSGAGTVTEASGVAVGSTANVTTLTVTAGSSQSTTDLQDWDNASSTPLYSINASGTPTNATDLMTKSAVATAISGATIAAASLSGQVPVASGGTGTATGSITGPGALTFTAGGSNQNVTLTPSGSGATILNGDVGIGTTSPSTLFQVGTGFNVDSNNFVYSHGYYDDSVSNGGLTFPGPGTHSVRLAAGSSGTVQLSASGGNDLYIANSGNVGIGTTNPGYQLDVYNDVNVGQNLRLSGTAYAAAGVGGLWIGDINGAGTGTLFYTNGSEKMRITTGGNVGIGTTAPVASLQVSGPQSAFGGSPVADGAISITYNGSSNDAFAINNTAGHKWFFGDGTAGSGGTFSFYDLNTGSTVLSLQSAGNVVVPQGDVGIGTTSPADPLSVTGTGLSGDENLIEATATSPNNGASLALVNDVGNAISLEMTGSNGSASNPQIGNNASILATGSGPLYIETDNGVSTGGSDSIYFVTGGYSLSTQTRMKITSSGNVGIGTTNPGGLLTLAAGTNTVAPLVLTAGANLTTPAEGAIEFDGTSLYYTDSTNARRALATTTSGSSQSYGQDVTLGGAGTGLTVSNNAVIDGSLSQGTSTSATGSNAVALGDNTTAAAYSDLAIGQFNVGGGTAGSWVATDPLFEIGNGTSSAAKSDALTVLKNGNVGISNATPSAMLDISGTNATATLRVFDQTPSTGNTRVTIEEGAGQTSDLLDFYNNGGSVLTKFGPNGALSIGTSVQEGRLYVGQDGAASASRGVANVGAGPFDGSTAGYFVGNANGTELAVNAASGFTGALADFQIAGVSKFDVEASGNVGVGTTNPGALFEVNGDEKLDGDLAMATGGLVQFGGGEYLEGGSGGFYFIAGNIGIGYPTASTLSGALNVNGNVGIGTTNPGSALTVGSTATPGNVDVTGQIAANVYSNSSTNTVNFNNGNVQLMTSGSLSNQLVLENMVSGGAYTVIVQGTTNAQTYAFTTGPGTQCTSALFNPAQAATTAGTQSVFTILYVSGTCYISWMSGFAAGT